MMMQRLSSVASLVKTFSSLSFSSEVYFLTTKKIVSTQQHVRLPRGYNPVSAFAIYFKEKSKSGSKEEFPYISMKLIAEKWNSLSEIEKEEYVNKAKKYNEEKLNKFLNHSKDEKNKLFKEDALRKKKIIRYRLRQRNLKFNEETNKPKRPMTPFFLFCKDQRDKDGLIPKGKEEIIKFGKNFGEKWNSMNADEKQVYLNKAEELRNNYKIKLEIWKNINAEKIEKLPKVIEAF